MDTEVTTIDGTTINAPNTTIHDTTPDAILSRVCTRIQERGLFVVGIYGGDWGNGRDGMPNRQFEIDVATAPEGDPLGQVIVRHSKVKAYYKVRGIAFNAAHHHQTQDSTRVGWHGGEEMHNAWVKIGWE
jgi:hypothetical protein